MQYQATLPLPERRKILKGLVGEARDKDLGAGVVFQGRAYQTDDRSIDELIRWVAAIAAGIKLPADFAWRDAGNVSVSHDAKSLKALAEAILLHRWGCYRQSFDAKDRIDSSETPERIDWKKQKKAKPRL